MIDQEKTQELKNRIERFLYEMVNEDEDATLQVKALDEIVAALIFLKFAGGADRVRHVVVDANDPASVSVVQLISLIAPIDH